jgi:hypothetical protein
MRATHALKPVILRSTLERGDGEGDPGGVFPPKRLSRRSGQGGSERAEPDTAIMARHAIAERGCARNRRG